MGETVNAIDVSNYVIQYLNKKGQNINHLKLQKLLYYIEAWNMVFLNSPIFADKIEAWQHGPVIRSVWDHFKRFSILYDELPVCETCSCVMSDEQRAIVDDVLDEYGDKTGYYLENLTHSEEPWRKARQKASQFIDKQFMKQYYGARLDVSKKQETKEPIPA